MLEMDPKFEKKYFLRKIKILLKILCKQGGALHVLWLEHERHQIFPIWRTNTWCATSFFWKNVYKIVIISNFLLNFRGRNSKKFLSRGALPPEPPVYIYCSYYLPILAFLRRSHTFSLLSSFTKNTFYNQFLLIISKFTILVCFILKI